MKKIVRGNDFTMRVPVRKIVGGDVEKFPLPACEEVEVNLVNAFRRRRMTHTIGVEDDSLLEVRVHSSEMALGAYALEVKGKLFGCSWRSNEYEQIMLVDNNAQGDTVFDPYEGEDSVEMDTAVVVLPPTVELTNLITDAHEATKKANVATDRANASADKADKAAAEAKKTADAAASEAKATADAAAAEAKKTANDAAALAITTANDAASDAERRTTVAIAEMTKQTGSTLVDVKQLTTDAIVDVKQQTTDAIAKNDKATADAVTKANTAADNAVKAKADADTATDRANKAAERCEGISVEFDEERAEIVIRS
ncbi:hypothetical protein [Prevotella sp.]|uniref:hypothetical protein n=1 Tax=Prevotella sp. TaxID=59823 RepID=UPI0027E333F5|nr:hypothetical protein [Prevotella sp.]